MPKLPIYEQQVRVNRGIEGRRASGSDFDVGRGLSALGEGVDRVGDTINRVAEQRDLSDMHAELAVIRADSSEELQRQVQSGEINAEDALDKYNEKVSERVSQLQGRMRTRAGQNAATTYGTNLTEGLREKAFQIKAAADGALTVDNFKQAHSKNGAAIYADPTQFETVLAETEALLNDPQGPYVNRLPADKRRELIQQSREELAILAARGTIDNISPELFKKQLKAGTWDGLIPPDKLPVLDNMADEAIRARQSDEDRAYRLAERAKKEAEDKTWGAMLQRMEKPDLGGLTFKEIVTNPSLSPQLKEHMRGVLEQRLKNPNQMSNPQVVLDVQKKIYLPPDHPDKIDDPRVVMNLYSVNNQLSQPDMKMLLADIETSKTQDALGRDLQQLTSTVHSVFMRTLVGQNPGPDLIANGDTATYNWRKDALAEIERYRAEGKNPRELLDPNSKEYLGSPGRLASYLGTAKTAIADTAARIQTLKAGDITEYNGVKYRFKGGDPADKSNYEVVPSIDVSDAPIPSVPGAP